MTHQPMHSGNAPSDGTLKVAVDLLREVVGPLEVSAAVIESEDGGEAIETLIDKVKEYVEHFDRWLATSREEKLREHRSKVWMDRAAQKGE